MTMTLKQFAGGLLHQLRSCSGSSPSRKRRVVVTGMGVVSCLGVGIQHVWSQLIDGNCGIQKLEAPEYEKIPCKVAGQVPKDQADGHLALTQYVSQSDQRSMSLATCYAMVAAQEALEQAQWKSPSEVERLRTGVAIGMGMVPLDEIVNTGQALAERGYNRVNPYFVPKILVNMASGHISLKYGFKGVNHSVSTACTTGVHAIGDAMRFIKHGDVDVMVCGGTEACIGPLAIAGFARMRALSTSYNDEPAKSSRPFDKDREGFVMSEGAGVLVLEELEHAKKRGAEIFAEVLGYGLSGDANHITAPCDDGNGAYRCMTAALADANVKPNEVGYINAHATSTPLGDAAESRAITKLFKNGNHFKKIAVSSTKGAVGHLLGAAGAVESIFTTMACHQGVLPPTLNCYNSDTEFELNYVPLITQPFPHFGQENARIALTNSFGFGGTNASICLKYSVEL